MTLNRSNRSTGLGNTETNPAPTKRQASPKYNYCFTYNNPEIDPNNLIEILKPICKKFIFQLEKGLNETPHYQGFISLIKKARITELKKIIHERIHFEESKGNEEQNVSYCSKTETRIEGPWTFNIYIKKPIKIIETLYPWQQFVIDIIEKEPDDRTVHWFWEDKGNVGKSKLAKYLVVKHQALFIDEGKKSDLMNLAFNTNWDNTNILVIDIPRDNHNGTSYKSIEAIKNGMICNTKYETGVKVFNSPHIIVFCNYPPDTTKLSADRWKIYNITELNKQLIQIIESNSKPYEDEYSTIFR